jgi:hypothetical protein
MPINYVHQRAFLFASLGASISIRQDAVQVTLTFGVRESSMALAFQKFKLRVLERDGRDKMQ